MFFRIMKIKSDEVYDAEFNLKVQILREQS
jgi:hypothetical protein